MVNEIELDGVKFYIGVDKSSVRSVGCFVIIEKKIEGGNEYLKVLESFNSEAGLREYCRVRNITIKESEGEFDG